MPLLSIWDTVCVPDVTRLLMLAAVELRLEASFVRDVTPFRSGIVSPSPVVALQHQHTIFCHKIVSIQAHSVVFPHAVR